METTTDPKPEQDTQGSTQEGEETKKWKDAYWKFCGKDSNNKEEIDTSVSWKEVPYDYIREQAAQDLVNKVQMVAPETREKYEVDARGFWDKFHQSNDDKFFKQRHYLHFQFPQLRVTPEGESQLAGKTVLEVGCGSGSTLFPLMNSHPNTFFYAFDFSPHVVEVVKQNPNYSEDRCKAFVWDIATEEPPSEIVGKVDMALMVFVLSAVAPPLMRTVIRRLAQVMPVGGTILFRDYGLYDMTQVRFLYKENRKLGDNYYVRADGTRTYYFTSEELESLFAAEGFEAVDLRYDTRELRNRKKCINMYRVWLTGSFVRR